MSSGCTEDLPRETFAPPERRKALIDELLHRHRGGEEEAQRALWDEIYAEVHRLARALLQREGARKPIETTVLVHELYLKMGGASFDNRAHLFGSLVRMMGQIITDAARRRMSQRRRTEGAARDGMRLEVAALGIADDPEGQASASAITALDRLDVLAPRAAAVAWLRFVGGLSVEQSAACLAVSPRTVKSDWAFARAWLHRELTAEGLQTRTPSTGEPDHVR